MGLQATTYKASVWAKLWRKGDNKNVRILHWKTKIFGTTYGNQISIDKTCLTYMVYHLLCHNSF